MGTCVQCVQLCAIVCTAWAQPHQWPPPINFGLLTPLLVVVGPQFKAHAPPTSPPGPHAGPPAPPHRLILGYGGLAWGYGGLWWAMGGVVNCKAGAFCSRCVLNFGVVIFLIIGGFPIIAKPHEMNMSCKWLPYPQCPQKTHGRCTFIVYQLQ